MALVNCEECGKQVSDRAEACPACGCPVRPAAAPAPNAPSADATTPSPAQDEPKASDIDQGERPAAPRPKLHPAAIRALWPDQMSRKPVKGTGHAAKHAKRGGGERTGKGWLRTTEGRIMLGGTFAILLLGTAIVAAFNSQEITDHADAGRTAAQAGNWIGARDHLTKAVEARRGCWLTWVGEKALVDEAQQAADRVVTDGRERFKAALEKGHFVAAAKAAKEPGISQPAFVKQVNMLAAYADVVIASMTDKELDELCAGKEPPAHLDGLALGCVDGLRALAASPEVRTRARGVASQGAELRAADIARLQSELESVPGPLFFRVQGKVIDRSANKLLIMGLAIPSDSDMRHEGAVIGDNQNLLIEDPNVEGDLGPFYSGAHCYRGRTTSRNRLGGVVPVLIFGSATPSYQIELDRAKRERDAIQAKILRIKAGDARLIREVGIKTIMEAFE